MSLLYVVSTLTQHQDLKNNFQSTDASHPLSTVSASAEPHLLSPEHAHTALPALNDMLGPSEPQTNNLPKPPAVQDTTVYTMTSSTPPIQKPSSPYYAEAPVPSGVVYPEPPGRSKSRASTTRPSESASDSPSVRSRKRQGSLADNMSGRLSPLSLGMPFSSFAVPDAR